MENVVFEAQKMLIQYLVTTAIEKGITQEMIAERTGYKQSSISRMLSGRFNPSLKTFINIANAIDCYLFVIDKHANDNLVDTMKLRWGKIEEN